MHVDGCECLAWDTAQEIEKKKASNKKEIGILNFFKLGFLTTASLDVCRRSSCILYRDGVVGGERKGDDGAPGIVSSSLPSRVCIRSR